MLSRLKELAAARKNIAFESTLASRTFAPWIRELRKTGYRFHLFYSWLPSPEMCVNRVHKRKTLGGHTVPAETIHRRYHAGVRNFFELYAPSPSTGNFSTTRKSREPSLHSGREGIQEQIFDVGVRDKLKEESQHGAKW